MAEPIAPSTAGTAVFAIVVSFNGAARIRETIAALLPQVGRVHVVDNGSEAETRRALEELALQPRVTSEFLPENQGIARALNIGVERGRQEGYAWFLTMDQDSTADAQLVAKMLEEVRRDPALRCLTPGISNFGGAVVGSSKDVAYAITSGNLVQAEVFARVGGYNEKLFIDGVDFDFSLRARAAGFRIRRVSAAVLHHRLGESSGRSLPRGYTQHSPLRRYYMFRNLGSLVCSHGLRFPGFAVKLLLSHLLLVLWIPVYDPAPSRSFKYILLGLRDFTRGVHGRKG